MNSKNIQPIILCGGSGTRLWPLSRDTFPKQYISLSSKNKHSLLQNTIKRLDDLKNTCRPMMICNENHRFLVAEQLREIDINPNSILLEPEGKNTAPAIAISAYPILFEGLVLQLIPMEVDGSMVALNITWSGKSSGAAHSFIIAPSSFFCFWENNELC